MILCREDVPDRREVIDLCGPDGNAFVLMVRARGLAKQLGLEWGVIRAEMTAGDYENLLQVFDKYFGDYVDLIR